MRYIKQTLEILQIGRNIVNNTVYTYRRRYVKQQRLYRLGKRYQATIRDYTWVEGGIRYHKLYKQRRDIEQTRLYR